MIKIEGKGGISATIIADSISPSGARITTFECEYPRMVHAELMTHRAFSRNAASSRAIPVEKMIDHIENNTARPVHWGKNQPGMQAKEECYSAVWHEDGDNGSSWWTREAWWDRAKDYAVYHAKMFHSVGYHKQIVNRLLEPFSFIKIVCTATEWDNFFYLRCHADAQPEIQELAQCMYNGYKQSVPIDLYPGDWHTPYYEHGYWSDCGDVTQEDGEFVAVDHKEHGHTLKEALMISSSCCAQVSYRKSDDSLDKAKIIYNRLVESKPVHASPFEHQATPMADPYPDHFDIPPNEKGVTHMDTNGALWSGNLKSFIQHRQLISGHVCNSYQP